MINEVYELSKALERAGVPLYDWYNGYGELPNITKRNPCIRITISDGAVESISEVTPDLGKKLRKYGSNQGTYPCMNLAPLYRITDEAVKKELSGICPEDLDDARLERIKGWCAQNNWNEKFQGKYRVSMIKIPEKLNQMLPSYLPLQTLIGETSHFHDPMQLHQALEHTIFQMLAHKQNISTALRMLFYLGDADKDPKDDSGSISVALESPKLIDMGLPAVSEAFTLDFNAALWSAEHDHGSHDLVDAFGIPFTEDHEKLQVVKFAGGFEAKLRTMFKEQHCQTRYGRIENASYPFSPQLRTNLQSAINWATTAEQENITWINTDVREILIAYPATLPEKRTSYTRMYKRPKDQTGSFNALSKAFIQELKAGRDPDTDPHAHRIQLFILRKIDKARTKIIYTRQTNPHELEAYSEAWTIGCSHNLPKFSFSQPYVPFPLDVADILNRFWQQDGTPNAEKLKPVPKYHGIELFLQPELSTHADLHVLVQGFFTLSVYLGKLLMPKTSSYELNMPCFEMDELIKQREKDNKKYIWGKVKEQLVLMGLLLYRENIRKETYMENFPYLYGQLLKTADALHVLYCKVVRDGDIPPNLVGSSLLQAASDSPIRSLNTLRQRINPYLIWASSYRHKKIEPENKEKNKEIWNARWLYNLFETISTKLYVAWSDDTRMNDVEKAQLFIGFLAAFPKREPVDNPNNSDDATDNTNSKEEK